MHILMLIKGIYILKNKSNTRLATIWTLGDGLDHKYMRCTLFLGLFIRDIKLVMTYLPHLALVCLVFISYAETKHYYISLKYHLSLNILKTYYPPINCQFNFTWFYLWAYFAKKKIPSQVISAGCCSTALFGCNLLAKKILVYIHQHIV